MKCEGFKPFRLAGDVCENCGELVGDHAGPVGPDITAEFGRTMWAVLLKHGGIHSQYSNGLDTWKSAVLRLHFGIPVSAVEMSRSMTRMPDDAAVGIRDCQIDWRMTGAPDMGTVSEFNDSFTPNTEHPAVTGSLTCRCGKYRFEQVSLPGKTLGQLIWLATHEGEGE